MHCMTTMMMNEAPDSPRSAALHYWGGNWGEEEEKLQDCFTDTTDDYDLEESRASTGDHQRSARCGGEFGGESYANLHDSTFQKRTSIHQPRRSLSKHV